MAEGGIPQGGAKGKRRVVVRQLRLFHHTRYAGIALLQRGWETLGVPAVLTAAGIVRRGHAAAALAFAQVVKPLVDARSQQQLVARCAGDELVQAACGPLSQAACSRFLNDARFAWPAVTARITAHLQTRRDLRTRPRGLLILDDTILEKAGRAMEGLQKLYDTAKQRFVRGYGLVVLYYTDPRGAYPLGYRLTRRRRGRPPKQAPRGKIALAIALLALLAERPMHGYDIIQELASRSGGAWRPSPGSIYPTLQMLEDEGLVTSEERDGKRVFSLTDPGKAEVETRKERSGGVPPWEFGQGGEGVVQLREAFFQLGAAAMQVAGAGSPQQVKQAAEIVAGARRKIYAILAEA